MFGEDPHRYMAPAFEVAIEGSRLGKDLTELVSSAEYESADGIADAARLTVSNPDYALSDSPMWQPGNEMDLWFGYGNELGYVGRTIIVKPEPAFVESGMPTIAIKGYTKDHLMMLDKPKLEEADIRNFAVDLIGDAVARIASREFYAFDNLDMDETPSNRFAAPQKADINDYNYVRGLANLLGWLFWVDYTRPEDGGSGWTLHFRDPNGLRAQELIYTFEHNRGDASTLLSFTPALVLTSARTKLQVQSRNPETGEIYVEEFDDTDEAPDAKYKGDPQEVIADEHTTAGALVKFFFGDFATEVISDKKFKSASDLKIWAEQWWRRNRENFVLGRGRVIGVDSLRARQRHNFILPSKSLSGSYYWSRARHIFDSGGYLVDFSARKEF